MFVFQFPFPFARLIGCLTRSVRFDLQRLRCSPLSLSLHYAIGELIKSLANWQIVNCDFCFCISEFFFFFMGSTRIQSYFANALFLFYFFIRFLKRVWPHEQRLYWSLAWHMAYGIRTTSTQHIQLLIGKSIDQLCRQRGATSLTVSELGSSYEIFS